MKTIALILILVFILPFFACKKEDMPHICATCIEHKSNYQSADFCNTRPIVERYVDELIESGNQLGQNWECTIH